MSPMTLSELRHAPRGAAEADFVSAEGFALMARMADVLTSSGLVPEDYRAEVRDAGRMIKNPAAQANCMMALCAARRLDLDPFSVMHGLRVTDRGPKWSDGLMLTALERCGRFAGPQFELARGATDDAGETGIAGPLCCVMRATEKSTGRTLEAGPVRLSGREDTHAACGEKAELALRRRALLLFCRLYAPDLFPGLPETDEDDGDDAETHALPRTPADSRDGAPRARVTLEEIARQARRSLEASRPSETGPLEGKTASPEHTEAAAPGTTHAGEGARTQSNAAPQSDAGDDASPRNKDTRAHAARHGTPTDAASVETPTGGTEATVKKTRKEGTPAKVPGTSRNA